MYSNKDAHNALKHETLGQDHSRSATFVFVKSQWGKNDVGYYLHADIHGFSSYGVQTADFLHYLGFRDEGKCPFVASGRCLVLSVNESFNAEGFGKVVDSSYSMLVDAQRDLEKCGISLDQPQGGSHFGGGSRRVRNSGSYSGDGHTAIAQQTMKQSEDEIFQFKMSWLETNYNKAWIIHYHPKHQPVSSEIQSVFDFLGFDLFEQCPEFDFEPCYWRSIPFSGDVFDNTHIYNWFDAQHEHFSSGIKKILQANSETETFGLSFLKFLDSKERLQTDITKLIDVSSSPKPANKIDKFDVTFSFAGSERHQAEQLAKLLRDAGHSVFYDDFYPEYLWGKNLVDTFDEIYRKRARYCVIFVSKEYNDRLWTNHERQSAQARALTEMGKEYILPIKVDDTELKGMPPTIGYISIDKGVEFIADLLIKKLQCS